MFILWAVVLFLLALFVIGFLFVITPYVLPIIAILALFGLSFLVKDIVIYRTRSEGKEIAISLQVILLSAAIILLFVTLFQMSIPQFVHGSIDMVNTSTGDILDFPLESAELGIVHEVPVTTIVTVIVGSLLVIYAMTTYGRVLEGRGRK